MLAAIVVEVETNVLSMWLKDADFDHSCVLVRLLGGAGGIRAAVGAGRHHITAYAALALRASERSSDACTACVMASIDAGGCGRDRASDTAWRVSSA